MNGFEKALDLAGWIRIIGGYLFLGAGIGAVLFFNFPGILGTTFLFSFVFIGLILGIWMAVRISRKMGSQEYLAKLSETPDLGKDSVTEKSK